jgi:hypothetical protein
MTRYLISFGAHAMDHIPDEEGPAVGKASHAVVQEALARAAKIAVACRCPQEVRRLLPDPEQDEMLRQADTRR